MVARSKRHDPFESINGATSIPELTEKECSGTSSIRFDR